MNVQQAQNLSHAASHNMAAESAQLKKQKERKSWTQSEIFRLIDLYEERSCLWDVFSNDYHNRGHWESEK